MGPMEADFSDSHMNVFRITVLHSNFELSASGTSSRLRTTKVQSPVGIRRVCCHGHWLGEGVHARARSCGEWAIHTALSGSRPPSRRPFVLTAPCCCREGRSPFLTGFAASHAIPLVSPARVCLLCHLVGARAPNFLTWGRQSRKGAWPA